MPLLRDVVTAVGIDLEGHGGHSGTMDEGRAIHVGLHAGICRPRRLAAVQPWPATAKTPSEGRPAFCATLPRTPATGSLQQGVALELRFLLPYRISRPRCGRPNQSRLTEVDRRMGILSKGCSRRAQRPATGLSAKRGH